MINPSGISHRLYGHPRSRDEWFTHRLDQDQIQYTKICYNVSTVQTNNMINYSTHQRRTPLWDLEPCHASTFIATLPRYEGAACVCTTPRPRERPRIPLPVPRPIPGPGCASIPLPIPPIPGGIPLPRPRPELGFANMAKGGLLSFVNLALRFDIYAAYFGCVGENAGFGVEKPPL